MPSLLPSVMKKIAAASERHDVAALETLTKVAKRVQELETTQVAVENELGLLAKTLTQQSTADDNVFVASEILGRNKIRVVLDWPLTGLKREKVVIEARKGSMTLVAFLEELHTVLGDSALEKIATLHVSRGPLISKKPADDFINKGSGATYAHHRIPQTPYFVITHSGTAEKIDAIHSVARLLNLQDVVRAQRT